MGYESRPMIHPFFCWVITKVKREESEMVGDHLMEHHAHPHPRSYGPPGWGWAWCSIRWSREASRRWHLSQDLKEGGGGPRRVLGKRVLGRAQHVQGP